jgi:CDP-paratose 2-epimerase
VRILITGGCGFIGSNLADFFAKKGDEVTVLDNLSRKGVEWNKKWLEQGHGKKIRFVNGDIRDAEKTRAAAKDMDAIFHTAAQVTVTESVKNPRNDFEINAVGTFNVMEAARLSNMNPIVIYTSTNKVYGHGTNLIPLKEGKTRYEYADKEFKDGVPESFSTDADEHSPYGNSKYTADLYVRDYSHIFGIKGLAFRQSCIYGTRQFGYEDQGWIAHFVISSVIGRGLNIYGDGKQVRDTLFMEDLINAFDMAIKNINRAKGQAYNIGGGPKNTISLLELITLLERLNRRKLETKYFDWRPADQKVYISDISKAKKVFGWEPKVAPEQGISRLNDWVKDNVKLFK